jgi:hypothetical protein
MLGNPIVGSEFRKGWVVTVTAITPTMAVEDQRIGKNKPKKQREESNLVQL